MPDSQLLNNSLDPCGTSDIQYGSGSSGQFGQRNWVKPNSITRLLRTVVLTIFRRRLISINPRNNGFTRDHWLSHCFKTPLRKGKCYIPKKQANLKLTIDIYL
jgi:hypothetical protein